MQRVFMQCNTAYGVLPAANNPPHVSRINASQPSHLAYAFPVEFVLHKAVHYNEAVIKMPTKSPLELGSFILH